MDMKRLSSPTSKKDVLSVEKLSSQERTRPISSSNEVLEYVLLLKEKVITILNQEPKCSKSNDVISLKILDLFSKEIILLEEEVLQHTGCGVIKTDSLGA